MMSHPVVGQITHQTGHDTSGGFRCRGFSLIEMLIVIGVIALLLAIAVTGFTKVRSMAKRTECAANLKTIGAAIHQYLVDNNDAFPLAASRAGHQDGDWVYWESTPVGSGSQYAIDLIGSGGIGKYISGLADDSPYNLRTLRCPIDERLESKGFLLTSPMQTQSHTAYPSDYPFSYVISAFMCSGNYPPGGPPTSLVARTMSKVRDGSTKIMVYEEDARTIDDGVGSLQPNSSMTNLLSVRHNITESITDPISVDVTPTQITTMNNADAYGNVLFADGHADYITRRDAHSKAHYAPDPSAQALTPMP